MPQVRQQATREQLVTGVVDVVQVEEGAGDHAIPAAKSDIFGETQSVQMPQ